MIKRPGLYALAGTMAIAAFTLSAASPTEADTPDGSAPLTSTSPARTQLDAAEEDLPDVAAPQIGDGLSEAELEDLATLAEQRGISLDEAIDNHGWHQDFALVVDELRKSLPEDFAYARIAGPREAEVWFARAKPLASRATMSEFERAYPGVPIRVTTDYGLTEIEADSALVAAHFAVYDVVGNAVSEFDHDNSRILITVPASAADEVETLMSRASDAVEEGVGASRSIGINLDFEVAPFDELDGDDAHYGGESLSTCTSGFTVVHTNGITRHGTTAGHCSNSQTDDGISLTFHAGYDGHWGDFQRHSGSQWESDDFYSGSAAVLEANRRDLSSWGVPVDNQSLCRNGKTTHKHCDWDVENPHVCSGGNCWLIRMTGYSAAGGDSGGPVFWGTKGYGAHKGRQNGGWFNPDRELYSRLDTIHEIPGWSAYLVAVS